MTQPLWTPSSQRIADSRITAFLRYLREQGLDPGQTQADFYRWSIDQSNHFWDSFWDWLQLQGEKGGEVTAPAPDLPQGVRFFPQARLNFAENLLWRGEPGQPAVIEHREDGRRRELTFRELREQSQALAGFLASRDIGPGDRVAGFVSNGAEAVIGMLATTQLGAIWTSCSPDFGRQGVLDRFGQIQPRALIAINGYQYNGKTIDTRERVTEIAASLPSLEAVILVDNRPAGEALPWAQLDRGTNWEEALRHSPRTGYTAMPFNAPGYILYSSGTTGAPKCIVHGIGGTLLQHGKELALHTDLKAGDRLFYYTTCGWMMWNWMVSALALGGTLVLFDGSPFSPKPEVLWEMAERENIRIFGASAKYFQACEKAGLVPGKTHQLGALDTLLSTGSPLSHDSFDYLYREVKQDLCLASISGGTDIVSCFALGNPCLPVYRGELQTRGLAMDVAFVDDDGAPLARGKGELVCRNAFPSMPVGFWDDPEHQRYRAAYYERFPGLWAHGDYGELCPHPGNADLPEQTGVIIHGRSDAVLNPGGVRIGTAEIYRQVEKFDQVLEALAIGQQWQEDVRVVLFVKLREGEQLTDKFRRTLQKEIHVNTTPRHVPARIIQVPDIPKTLSGKIVELAVRNVVHGEPVRNQDALANPDALRYFGDLPELKT